MAAGMLARRGLTQRAEGKGNVNTFAQGGQGKAECPRTCGFSPSVSFDLVAKISSVHLAASAWTCARPRGHGCVSNQPRQMRRVALFWGHTELNLLKGHWCHTGLMASASKKAPLFHRSVGFVCKASLLLGANFNRKREIKFYVLTGKRHKNMTML